MPKDQILFTRNWSFWGNPLFVLGWLLEGLDILYGSMMKEIQSSLENTILLLKSPCPVVGLFLASQDAIEVMFGSEWVIVCNDLTDVTLVSEDTYKDGDEDNEEDEEDE